MIKNKNTDPNCFDHVGDKCINISVTAESLDIQGGIDSLETALVKIINEIICLKEAECDPCNKCKEQGVVITSDVGNLTTSNKPLSRLSSPFELKIEPTSINTAIEYDITDALPAEGVAITNVEAFGIVNGRPSRIFRSSSNIGTFDATPENFPVNINIDVTCMTPEGQEIMKFNKSVTNTRSTSNEVFTVLDLSKTSLVDQKDVNEHFDRMLSSLENSINSINKINLNGKTGFNSIMSEFQTQLNKLSSDIDGNEDNAEALITQLEIIINSQQNTIDSQTKAIEALQTKVDSLAKTIGV